MSADAPRQWYSPRAPVIARVGDGDSIAYAARCVDCGYFGPEFGDLSDYSGMEESIRDVDDHSRAEHVKAWPS
jgi:hypothetical protein